MSIKWFLKTHTYYRCDKHGMVAGSLFTPRPDSKFGKGCKYGINYCCGTAYGSGPVPIPMWDQLLEEMDIDAVLDQE